MPTTLSAFTRRNLDEQGFGELDEAAKARNAWPLRFTPAVSISLIAIGLALQSPYWMGAMALVALSGALVPRGMIVDLVYNLGARYLLHAPPLPPTPRPRQFSYLISTAFLAGSAACFYKGWAVLGSILGGLVFMGGAVLTATLWCLGSWYFKLLFGPVAPSTPGAT